MWKWRFQGLLYLFAIFLLAGCFNAAAGEAVVIAYNDYYPYTSTKNGGSGVVIELTTLAFAEMHRDVVLKITPWEECETMLKEGSAFGAAPYRSNEARLALYDFSDPMINSINRFFYNAEKFPAGFNWNRLEDFRGHPMGATIGHWYIPAFRKAGLQVDMETDDLPNLAKLVRGKIDFFLLDELVGKQMMKEKFSGTDAAKIRILDKMETMAPLHVMISRRYPDHEQLTRELNQGLKKLVASGRYRKVLQSYGLPEYFATSK